MSTFQRTSLTTPTDLSSDERRKPDYIIKIRTEERASGGKYGYYVIGAAWIADHDDKTIYLDVNFPNPFLVDNQTKIVLFPNNKDERGE